MKAPRNTGRFILSLAMATLALLLLFSSQKAPAKTAATVPPPKDVSEDLLFKGDVIFFPDKAAIPEGWTPPPRIDDLRARPADPTHTPQVLFIDWPYAFATGKIRVVRYVPISVMNVFAEVMWPQPTYPDWDPMYRAARTTWCISRWDKDFRGPNGERGWWGLKEELVLTYFPEGFFDLMGGVDAALSNPRVSTFVAQEIMGRDSDYRARANKGCEGWSEDWSAHKPTGIRT